MGVGAGTRGEGEDMSRGGKRVYVMRQALQTSNIKYLSLCCVEERGAGGGGAVGLAVCWVGLGRWVCLGATTGLATPVA